MRRPRGSVGSPCEAYHAVPLPMAGCYRRANSSVFEPLMRHHAVTFREVFLAHFGTLDARAGAASAWYDDHDLWAATMPLIGVYQQ